MSDSASQSTPLRLLLASKSARRAQLLRDAGIPFTQAEPHFDDPPQPQCIGVAPEALAADLARRKGESLLREAPPSTLILGADTICVGHEGTLIGTPVTRDEARTMLRSFTGCVHQVVSGVALIPANDPAKSVLIGDSAGVAWGDISDAIIETYLDSGAWQGKAGGYNLFDRQAAGWPITTTGDPTTVVGLPMAKLLPALEAFSIVEARA